MNGTTHAVIRIRPRTHQAPHEDWDILSILADPLFQAIGYRIGDVIKKGYSPDQAVNKIFKMWYEAYFQPYLHPDLFEVITLNNHWVKDAPTINNRELNGSEFNVYFPELLACVFHKQPTDLVNPVSLDYIVDSDFRIIVDNLDEANETWRSRSLSLVGEEP